MNNNHNQKPCAVQTSQGFSVSYKEHFLYSKYNPSKLINSTIEKLEVLPGTIILCFSPVLSYGINELLLKLKENCLIVLIENDEELHTFSKEQNASFLSDKNIIYPLPKELPDLPLKLYEMNSNGQFKRIIRIDFSAGVQFNSQFYDELYTVCTNNIITFWKNRFTLTKFGRRYSHNFFTNLKSLKNSLPITNFFSAIEKPILVFGAGQSVDTFFASNKLNYEDFYILCVDTALQPLLKRKIIPNGVFVEEAQSVISKAFIGALNNKVHLFAGLSSLPLLSKIRENYSFSFFTTEYTNSKFLSSLKQTSFLPPVNPPFGSVGLTAVYYALKFRKDENIPVFVVGMDFSYSPGLTHAKDTLANNLRLSSSNRLSQANNYNAAFSESAVSITDKNGNKFITTPTLKSYSEMFNNLFASAKNLYDSGDSGIPLSILRGKPLPAVEKTSFEYNKTNYKNEQIQELNSYLLQEIKELEYLKNLLTGKIQLPKEQLECEIKKIATSKEYLYLHFADGYCFNYTQSFLNRIRTEIDFFLKILK